MANPEHLAILKEGVEVWNNWRYENLDLIPDLSWADLSWANLCRADLCRAFLYSANLSRAYLFEANLSGVDLSGANLSEANLSGALLYRANLSRAFLYRTKLSRAFLNWANLSGANLSWAFLYGANLSGADLNGADLSRADLNWANLSGADLLESQVIGTNFHNATLTGSCIKDWQINSKTNLDEVICEYVYLDLEFVDFYFYIEKTERRPINGNFESGEFASLYKKIIENTDLILSKTPQNDNNINNQGIQFYSDSIIHTWENLRFRSKTEIKIAEALDRAGVLFVPNSLARLNTSKGRENKEADFLICYNGKWGVLEVDGPFHTAERRVEEQERERIFKKNGIKVVERFDSERCYNNPDEVVQEFFKMIEIGYS
ncbi:pentapeptide repeat-containing protein [Aphanizomenon flos-aquae]|uniref:pentapeptide repeat-containing protein n=1 Tax=Aphanizomenon flos-aquae TaxID=1176 RepID=UPI0004B5F6E2|nr:pentapeptide repeat-containing protein [Aphanizomenon flos-aquae]